VVVAVTQVTRSHRHRAYILRYDTIRADVQRTDGLRKSRTHARTQ